MTWAPGPHTTVGAHPDGDGTHIDIRLLVAPGPGRFELVDDDGAPSAGDLIHHGTVIGHVVHAGQPAPVRSFCHGVLVEVLADTDEHVRLGQPLACVRPVAP